MKNKPTVFAYLRVSTKHQDLDRQEARIKRLYPSAVVYSEKYSGRTCDRPVWNRLTNRVKEGDTIVFDSVSRFARNAAEGFAEYEALFNRGVNLKFIREPMLDTDNFRQALATTLPETGTSVDIIIEAVNRFLMETAKAQIRAAFEGAEKELNDIHDRIKGGIEAKKNRNQELETEFPETYADHPDYTHFRVVEKGTTYETAKAKEAKRIIKLRNRDFDGDLSDAETLALTKVSRNSYFKYKRQLRQEMEV